ncbi:MAG: hypothetical protein D6820_00555, partial [Lentisphaerae bacterium]
TQDSPVYTAPIRIEDTTTIRAATFALQWPYGKSNRSRVRTLQFVRQTPLPALQLSNKKLIPGLTCELFERFVTIYDRRGFFTGRKNMIPDLDIGLPRLKVRTDGLRLPRIPPLAPRRRQTRAYYRFRGFLHVPVTGTWRFKLHSTGPVYMRLDGHTVIEHNQLYYNSQRDRFGAISLQTGLHRLEIVLCDPVFYRGRYRAVFKDYGHHGTVPIAIYYEKEFRPTLKFLPPGKNSYTDPVAGQLLCDTPQLPLWEITPVRGKQPLAEPGTSAGFILSKYDIAQRLKEISDAYIVYPRDLLTPRKQAPFATEITSVIAANSHRKNTQLHIYRALLYIPVSGIWHFQTDPAGVNQLLIDDVEVQNSRLDGDWPSGAILLQKGYHTFELRLWQSDAYLRFRAPGQTRYSIVPSTLFRLPPTPSQ